MKEFKQFGHKVEEESPEVELLKTDKQDIPRNGPPPVGNEGNDGDQRYVKADGVQFLYFKTGGKWNKIACTSGADDDFKKVGKAAAGAQHHKDSVGMPDTYGRNSDHDQRYAVQLSDDEPAIPDPFTGMLWYDTDATGATATSTVNVTSVVATYTITADDVVIICNGTFTITLPSADGISGKMYWIKNVGTGLITLACLTTIDDVLTQPIAQYEAICVIANGQEWWVL